MSDHLIKIKKLLKDHIFLKVKLALGIILLLLFFWYSINVLLLVFCAILIAVALRIASSKLHRNTRLNEGISLALVIGFVVLFITILVTTATPTIVEQIQIFANSVPSAFDTLKQQLNQFGWGKELLDNLDVPRDQFTEFLTDSSSLLSQLTGVFSTTFDVIAALFVILLMAIYLASEPALYIDGFIKLFPVSRRERMREVFKQAYDVLKGWFLGQLLSMSILGLLMTTGLWLLDVPLALTLGVFTAIMTFIPNFGPLIAGIPTVLLALSASPMTGFYTLIWIFIVQNMEGTFITPLVHRNIISLPPALIISTQILLASVYGFIGLVVAMPLVALGMVFVKTLYVEDVLEANMNNETSDSIQIISSKNSS